MQTTFYFKILHRSAAANVYTCNYAHVIADALFHNTVHSAFLGIVSRLQDSR